MTAETAEYLPEEKLIAEAIEALLTKLGPVEAARFLTLARGHRLESVAQHTAWQATLERTPFYNDIFGPKTPPPG